jgi:hypothetical protein
MPCPSSERPRPSRIGSIVQIPNPICARSGMKVPWVVHPVAVDAPGRGRTALVEGDLAPPKPGDVVVDVLIGRLDDVIERLAGSPGAQLLVQREHAGGGAEDGEHALAHVEVEHLEGGHRPAVVPRVPADVLDREVDGEGRGPIRRQLELARGEDEVLGAVGGLEPVVGQREARDRDAHLAPADGQLGVGVQWEVLATGWERQARRAPARRVEVRPPELVVGDEAVAGGCGLRLRRHGFSSQSRSGAMGRHGRSPFVCAPNGFCGQRQVLFCGSLWPVSHQPVGVPCMFGGCAGGMRGAGCGQTPRWVSR